MRKIPLRANENSKVKTNKLPKARENADDQVMMGFSFASDWLRKGREFFWTNHRAKNNTIPDNFRHSIENCFDEEFLLITPGSDAKMP